MDNIEEYTLQRLQGNYLKGGDLGSLYLGVSYDGDYWVFIPNSKHHFTAGELRMMADFMDKKPLPKESKPLK